jgi:hypothetical protein
MACILLQPCHTHTLERCNVSTHNYARCSTAYPTLHRQAKRKATDELCAHGRARSTAGSSNITQAKRSLAASTNQPPFCAAHCKQQHAPEADYVNYFSQPTAPALKVQYAFVLLCKRRRQSTATKAGCPVMYGTAPCHVSLRSDTGTATANEACLAGNACRSTCAVTMQQQQT